jgi:RNA polymerase sigma-70 factor, ECF subfamily
VADELRAPSEDEPDLLERVKAGDWAAFDDLVRRYMRRAYAVAYRILGRKEDAEDVTQEAYLAALEKIDTFDSSRPFAPWLYRIVANRSINARKARALRRAEPLSDQAESSAETPARSYERLESKERLARALEKLPERQRLIVRLFELDGFSSSEIGAMLDLSDGTVRWHLHQARAALREALAGGSR